MKPGWQRKPLGSILLILNGYAFDAKAFSVGRGTPLIRIRDLKNGVTTQTNFDGPFDQRYVVTAGSFLIGMDGDFGCFEWQGPDALLNQRVCKLHSFANDINPRFLFYGINKHLKEIEDNTTFTTVKHLSSKQVANIEFAFPPIDEQRRIVAVLDKAFAGIATATANAQKNLTNARALFESYLEAIFTARGDGWSESKLSEICELISGQHIDAQDYNVENKGIGYLTGPSDFGPRTPVITKWTEHPKRTADKGDILITVKGSGVGKINFLDIDNIAISRQLMAVRAPHEMIGYIYNFLLLKFDHFQSLANGAAIPGISRDDVLDLQLSLPPASQFTAIIEKMDEVSTLCSKLLQTAEAKLAALSELKQSLLQKAFAGELT